tara:strand:+ start:265 stop:1059 length:795 start_codon:yes stop_codon:yes gene_type:complete
MDETEIAYELMKAAVSGVSKVQTLNYIKNTFNLAEEQLVQILNICNLKVKPKEINYKEIAGRGFKIGRTQYKYPFTQIYTFDNFLTPEDCQTLIEESNKKLRPSTVSNVKDKVVLSKDRTSKTADLAYFTSSYLNEIDNKITAFMGLDPFTGEIMQTQKYEPGQFYKAHTDYFHPLTREYKTYTEWMGQRTWTFMLYLNDVEEGGETYFKHLKLKIKPKQGMAVFWNNLYRNGIPNPKTLHEACPPVSGEKYVITKWFRSWPLI